MKKVISGGQTGVDRAALDVAMELGIECGGWCPMGRLAEDGTIPDRYPMDETPTPAYEERTEWNVRDSDGTLVLTTFPPTGGTAYTLYVVDKLGKPFLAVDLGDPGGPGDPGNPGVGVADVERMREWLDENSIGILNVAGPRESKVPGIREAAARLLRLLLT